MKPLALALAAAALLASACRPADAPPADADYRHAEALRPDDAALGERWERSCRLCHTARGTGAPLAGHAPSWRPRLAQGQAVLLQHARDGLNAMPPRGQCPDCSDEDLLRLIDFMSRAR